jgi:23S rRNA (cytidine1920-2'-O)/16S rRNA (cytidine1409-2'-O)-methyltransferase
VAADAAIAVKGEDIPFVSRGGLKLEEGLNVFAVEVRDSTCLDVGASTDGFTDCLLQRGARRVYAVDVGYGQLAWKLRQDPRVIAIERSNIRNLPASAIPERVDMIAIDVSFISLRIVVPAVIKFAKPGAPLLALIKPQFEVGREKVGKGGVVRDAALHEAVIAELTAYFTSIGLRFIGVTPSPILGPKGNREFIACLHCPDAPLTLPANPSVQV